MASPKLVPGTLYFNRDRDYRTGAWGPYVKIGIVRESRSAEDRVKEHQTGNPREVLTTHTLQAPMVEHLETQLHHRFALHWVSGEWFEMSQEFVVDVVMPEAKKIIAEQTKFRGDFEQQAELKDRLSSGESRQPTEEERADWACWKSAREALILAKAEKQLADLALRAAIGDACGISGVVRLVEKSGKPTLDRKALEAAHSELCAGYLKPRDPAVKGSLLCKGALSLAKLDADLADRVKTAKAAKPTFTAAHVSTGVAPATRTDAHRALHAEFVQSIGSVARADWDVECWEARLARRVGEDDAIEGLVVWKRALKEQSPTFDQKAFKADHPDLFEQHLKPARTSVSVDILFHRPYAIS